MRMTTKGQVTIPLPVRRGLGLKPGSEVEFILRPGEAVLRAAVPDTEPREREVAEFVAHLRSFSGVLDLGGMTSDEFMSLMRD